MNIVYISLGIVSLILFFSVLYRHKNARNNIIHIVESNCVGCQCCLKRCHHQVLDVVSDKTGKHIVVKYPDRCSGCGDCLWGCKYNALELVERTK